MSDVVSKRYKDGSIVGSGDDWNKDHYKDNNIHFPVEGVVLEIVPSDHPSNTSIGDDSNLRGFYWEATVAILNDGLESKTAPLEHVKIAPNGPCGLDNFSQDLPTPTTGLIDGSAYNGKLVGVDLDKLNGDRVLVQFIGGKYSQPVITSWMPHPSNRRDHSTAGFAEGSLDQGRPFLSRRHGSLMTVTPEGSIHIDTNGAGSIVKGSEGGYKRSSIVGGGDIRVDVKPSRAIIVDFNEQLFVASQNPSLIQPNPAPSEVASTEQDSSKTTLTMDSDFFIAAAGTLLELQTIAGDMVLLPSDRLFFGNEASEENMVLGQKWKETMVSFMSTVIRFIESYQNHIHPTGMGPSGTLMEPEFTVASDLIDAVQPLIDNVDDNLSDYIFGSKEAPVIEIYDKEEETGEE